MQFHYLGHFITLNAVNRDAGNFNGNIGLREEASANSSDSVNVSKIGEIKHPKQCRIFPHFFSPVIERDRHKGACKLPIHEYLSTHHFCSRCLPASFVWGDASETDRSDKLEVTCLDPILHVRFQWQTRGKIHSLGTNKR